MINEILKRLSAETPKFFKSIRKVALTVASLSGFIVGADLTIPDSIGDLIAKAGIVAGLIAAFISSLPTIWGLDENGNIIK